MFSSDFSPALREVFQCVTLPSARVLCAKMCFTISFHLILVFSFRFMQAKMSSS